MSKFFQVMLLLEVLKPKSNKTFYNLSWNSQMFYKLIILALSGFGTTKLLATTQWNIWLDATNQTDKQ